jgi:hypothetical protein
VLLPLLLAGSLTITPPANGEELIRAMQQRYAGKWYKTLTFVQTTSFPDKGTQETWYEAAQIPGTLRIDISPVDSGRMILFRNDTISQFKGGKLVGKKDFIHPLMVLGFDVYAQPPEVTSTKLKNLGFDLTKIREDKWQGRAVYVVGAAAGDSTTNQFWVDKERLLFVRMIEPAPDGSGARLETQFNKYQPLGKGWIAIECVFNVNGATKQKEEYADVKGDVPLPDTLWDSETWARPEWVGSRP